MFNDVESCIIACLILLLFAVISYIRSLPIELPPFTKMLISIIFFVDVLLWRSVPVSAKVVEGTIRTSEDWRFLSRFCFLSKTGKLDFYFKYPEAYLTQDIILYYDVPQQWPYLYENRDKLSCKRKMEALKPGGNQVINLTTMYTWSGCDYINIRGKRWLECAGQRTFRSARERWWYIVVGACSRDTIGVSGLYLEYRLVMTNSLREDDVFFYHFSADEFNILQTNIGFFAAFVFTLVLSGYVAYLLSQRHMYHTTFKLYMASLTIKCGELAASVATYAYTANSGKDSSSLRALALFLEWAGEVLLLLLIMLMAKGFTVTRGRISGSGTVKLGFFITAYTLTRISVFIYSQVVFDPGAVLYLYESPPGTVLLVIREVGWLWFCYGCFVTLKKYPEKKTFYTPFIVFYSFWLALTHYYPGFSATLRFHSLLAIVLSATHFMPKYSRAKTVNGIVQTFDFIAYFFFLITAMRPTNPYGSSSPDTNGATTNGFTCDDANQSFAHNPYAVAGSRVDSTAKDPDFSMFSVSQTIDRGDANANFRRI